jgi:hypothetical protein
MLSGNEYIGKTDIAILFSSDGKRLSFFRCDYVEHGAAILKKLFQTLDGGIETLTRFFEILVTGGVGKTYTAVVAKGGSRNNGEPLTLKNELAQVYRALDGLSFRCCTSINGTDGGEQVEGPFGSAQLLPESGPDS